MVSLANLKKINSDIRKVASSITQSTKVVVTERKITFLDMDNVTKRIDACHQCSFYKNGICNLCGCMVSVKSRISEFKSPLGLWEPEELPTSWKLDESKIDFIPKAFHRDENFVYAYSKKPEGIYKYVTSLITKKTEIVKI